MAESFETKLENIVARLPLASQGYEKQNLAKLRDIGVTTFERLCDFAQNTQHPTELRVFAVWLLARLNDTRVIPILLMLLKDNASEVRREVALRIGAIGKSGDSRATLPLIEVMQTDSNVEVRVGAAYALRWFTDETEAVVSPLLHILQNQQEDALVRGEAAESLGELAVQEAVPTLIEALHDPAAEVRLESAFALSLLGDARALPELERVASTDDEVVRWQGAAPKFVKDEALEAIEYIRQKLNLC